MSFYKTNLVRPKKKNVEMDSVRSLEKNSECLNRDNNSNCLEFRGIPEYKDETTGMLKNIIINRTKKANYTTEADINSIYRTGTTQKNDYNNRPEDKGPKQGEE